jgi:hypothetical protein
MADLFRDPSARTHDCPHHMAVRADELAFGQLVEHDSAAAAGHHRADLSGLEMSREMIPMHHIWRKDPATVQAGATFLKGVHPRTRGATPRPRARQPRWPAALRVIASVIGAPAVGAVRKLTGARAAEGALGPRRSALRAGSGDILWLVHH